MMRPIQTGLLGLATATVFGALVGAAAAQSGGAPLSSMPMPPSAGEAPPKAGAKAKPQKPARKRADRQGAGASAGSGSGASVDRPTRFVPEEFDRGGPRDSGAGTRPMVTPSGRPGMGMQF